MRGYTWSNMNGTLSKIKKLRCLLKKSSIDLNNLQGNGTNGLTLLWSRPNTTDVSMIVVSILSRVMIWHICCYMWIICWLLRETIHVFRSLKLSSRRRYERFERSQEDLRYGDHLRQSLRQTLAIPRELRSQGVGGIEYGRSKTSYHSFGRLLQIILQTVSTITGKGGRDVSSTIC